jgi:ubiquinone/menaquinone biosynthesis C-methylase UbiE
VVSRKWSHPEFTRVTVADYGDGATITPEDALAVPDGTYDAILCCQTLDHLPNPLNTLADFRLVAKPGARLFVDVVKREHTKLKLDHEWYPPTASCFLALIERADWVPLWLDGETNPTHWSVLAWR